MDSRFIEHRLSELKDRKSKNVFLESIMVEPSSSVIYEINGHKTTIFPGCKGPKTNTWKQTKKMANSKRPLIIFYEIRYPVAILY